MRRWIRLADEQLPPDIVGAISSLLDVPDDLINNLWSQVRVHGEYNTFQIRLDKAREINVPSEALRQVQLRALTRILYTGPVSPPAYAGVPGRNVVSAARKHFDREAGHVIAFDISDAYGNTTYSHVMTALKHRLSRDLWVLGLSGTEQQQVLAVLGYFLTVRRQKSNGRKLPLGAPTSVALFNLICLELDGEIMQKLLDEQHQSGQPIYTRYVDDLVFSSSKPFPRNFVGEVAKVIKGNGFNLNDEKTRTSTLSKAKIYGLQKAGTAIVPGRDVRERLAGRITEHRAIAENEKAAPRRRLRSRAALRAIDGYLRQFYELAGIERPEALRFNVPTVDSQPITNLDLLWA